MRNYERAAQRREERTKLRRAYTEGWWTASTPLDEIVERSGHPEALQHSRSRALDVEALLAMVSHGTTAPCNVLRNRIVMRYLRDTLAVPAAAIAAAFKESGEHLERALSEPLLAPPELSAAIEQYLDERYAETPEPDRVIAPTGQYAIPGERYPLSVLPGGRGAS